MLINDICEKIMSHFYKSSHYNFVTKVYKITDLIINAHENSNFELFINMI